MLLMATSSLAYADMEKLEGVVTMGKDSVTCRFSLIFSDMKVELEKCKVKCGRPKRTLRISDYKISSKTLAFVLDMVVSKSGRGRLTKATIQPLTTAQPPPTPGHMNNTNGSITPANATPASGQLLGEKGIQTCEDCELVAKKMMSNPTIVLKDAGKNLRSALLETVLHTREFSLAAVSHDLQLFQDLHDDFKTDEQVALAVVTKRASMLYDLPYKARNFLSVQVAAASQDKGWLSILLPTDKKRAEEAVDALKKNSGTGECISGPQAK